ncbi:MAG TPA: glycosyltransferase family 4 protein [Bryobacteraceae bacterium]|nr:glycosyltransferase family 4 protein [Bryobacteraceae bacterium]
MRALITADTVGGVWTYALELAHALVPLGVEPVLATMGAPLSAAQRTEAAGIELYESTFKLEWMDDPWEDVARAGAWLLELEAGLHPDVVHLNGFAHGALPWRAPVLTVGHSCVLSWWRAVRGGEAPASWNRYRAEIGRGLRNAAIVAAPTCAMLESLRRDYGPLPRPCVIPNGRAAASFPPGPKEPLLFTAGRVWDEGKNLAALEAVAPRLPWPIWVAGDNRRPGGGLRASPLRILGKLPGAEIAGWLARASIYVLPARYEPFGLSALEAALAGCALVLGDIPSLREVWGDAACYVPPDNAAALEDALLRMIEDEPHRAEMAALARSRAHLYTPERMGRAYASAYRALGTRL